MKNALILHGTANTSQGNWFPWLSNQLKNNGYIVWSPDLPDANNPDADRYNRHIFSNKEWKFNSESIVIGHSSGGVAALKLLQQLPKEVVIDTCFTIGAFIYSHGWNEVSGLFTESFDFKKIKSHAKRFIIFHSDNDPYVPFADAELLRDALDAELVFIKGQGHFNLDTGPQYKEFPALLEKILS